MVGENARAMVERSIQVVEVNGLEGVWIVATVVVEEVNDDLQMVSLVVVMILVSRVLPRGLVMVVFCHVQIYMD